MKSLLPLVSVLALSLTILACAGSGPNLATIASEEELSDDDRKLWTLSECERDHFRNAGLLHPNSELTEYVQEVGGRLVPEELRRSILEFDFQVILSPEPNAFSLPDGQVFVHLGLLPWLDNESQLAHVLAHEIAHIVNRDAVSTYTHRENTILMARVLSWASHQAMKDKADDSFWWSLLALSTRSAINLTAMATLNGHGLRAEQAADETALTYMALAGYDVSEAPRLLESLREHRPAAALVMYFFVDPVQLQARRDHLNGCIARSRSLVSRLRPPRSGTQSAAEYRRRTESARRTLVELWVRNRMYGPAIRFAKEILAERPDDAHMCYWLGEAYRGDETAPNARALARESYLSALSHESMFAEPHRGLGELAESEGDITTALREYRMYLEQSPTARDRRYYAAKIATLGESDE